MYLNFTQYISRRESVAAFRLASSKTKYYNVIVTYVVIIHGVVRLVNTPKCSNSFGNMAKQISLMIMHTKYITSPVTVAIFLSLTVALQ